MMTEAGCTNVSRCQLEFLSSAYSTLCKEWGVAFKTFEALSEGKDHDTQTDGMHVLLFF